jgi:hypothetical protein
MEFLNSLQKIEMIPESDLETVLRVQKRCKTRIPRLFRGWFVQFLDYESFHYSRASYGKSGLKVGDVWY